MQVDIILYKKKKKNLYSTVEQQNYCFWNYCYCAFFTVLQSSVIASGDNFGLNSLLELCPYNTHRVTFPKLFFGCKGIGLYGDCLGL